MEAFPAYAKVVFDSMRRSFDPSILRTDMERGFPKQRLLNSQVLMKDALTLYFYDLADALAFEDWYFGPLARIGFFTMTHPVTGQSLTCRFENGSIGELAPGQAEIADFQRSVVVEYLR
ncbi:hypothetical protein [Pseudoxanthomonas winnipegensis]|uniref:Uncharacterized protein n=1 Tax=Pseudoxanthomonas winnipegensis TaxID=2480810 RepID=A0ABY1WB17_9GAMM|nr:hypothetical protein [Pseudoxanthomonas winnipegensis]RZZ81937.1 hypothetical protein EA662_17350 [Pseudoxanthomonas winnipegensis]TAA18193.1 hypothetical protein EA658_13660 [Pseudoxanthomonas winnipegensis]TAA42197.1 hypothetical protein EAT51_07975 [Pseudoxanthomonas winnipegensis]TBV72304.1 hypothetical protein EYC46_16980 [Pseudoxanthomonas winnipegensis]